jgi:hypothetical protein
MAMLFILQQADYQIQMQESAAPNAIPLEGVYRCTVIIN